MSEPQPQEFHISQERLQRDQQGIPRYLHEIQEALAGAHPPEQGYDYKLKTDDTDEKLAGWLLCYSGWTGGCRIVLAAAREEPTRVSVGVTTASRAYRFGLICFLVVLLAAAALLMFTATGTVSLGGIMLAAVLAGLPFLLLGTLGAHLFAGVFGKRGHRFSDAELAEVQGIVIRTLAEEDPGDQDEEYEGEDADEEEDSEDGDDAEEDEEADSPDS